MEDEELGGLGGGLGGILNIIQLGAQSMMLSSKFQANQFSVSLTAQRFPSVIIKINEPSTSADRTRELCTRIHAAIYPRN